MAMHRSIGAWLALALAAATLASCAATTGRGRATLVPVTDLRTVAGTWTGLVRQGTSAPDDWVELTIRADGAYEASSAPAIGAFKERGTLRLDGGALRSSGPNGSAVYRLYYQGGARVLLAEYTAKDGTPYSAEFTIAR
jgi:predicted small secreted protein